MHICTLGHKLRCFYETTFKLPHMYRNESKTLLGSYRWSQVSLIESLTAVCLRLFCSELMAANRFPTAKAIWEGQKHYKNGADFCVPLSCGAWKQYCLHIAKRSQKSFLCKNLFWLFENSGCSYSPMKWQTALKSLIKNVNVLNHILVHTI